MFIRDHDHRPGRGNCLQRRGEAQLTGRTVGCNGCLQHALSNQVVGKKRGRDPIQFEPRPLNPPWPGNITAAESRPHQMSGENPLPALSVTHRLLDRMLLARTDYPNRACGASARAPDYSSGTQVPSADPSARTGERGPSRDPERCPRQHRFCDPDPAVRSQFASFALVTLSCC
jgi:hypothetical protein